MLVVLPIVLGFVFFDAIHAFYLVTFVAPRLENDLGFEGAYQRAGSDQELTIYTLVSVDPNGVLGRAGARSGDVPCRFVHGIESGFLGLLHESRGEEVSLFLCDGKRWSAKRVTFVVPRSAI